jgi:beta-1,4-N-acetylglucosaminyltransferase
MIFLTVGTQFAFDRLIKSVDQAIDAGHISGEIIAQIGQSVYQPRNFDAKPFFDKPLFDKHLSQSSAMIAHAGMGTITMAMQNNKPLLAMPRLKKYGEVVNDHQLALAKRFEEFGHILVAYDEFQIPEKIQQLKTFIPRQRFVCPQTIAESISKFLTQVENK